MAHLRACVSITANETVNSNNGVNFSSVVCWMDLLCCPRMMPSLVQYGLPQRQHSPKDSKILSFDSTYTFLEPVIIFNHHLQTMMTLCHLFVCVTALPSFLLVSMACLRDDHRSRWPHRQHNSMILRGWNNSFHTLCGDHHPSIWTVIEALRQDEVLATSATLQDKIGERRRKQCRRTQKTFEEHLLNLVQTVTKNM